MPEVSRVQEPERWPCTKPAVREHDGNAGPLPEVERCTHDECHPPGPTVLLDAPERTVDDVHRDLDQVVAKLASKLAADPSPTKTQPAPADRDIPEELVEKAALEMHDQSCTCEGSERCRQSALYPPGVLMHQARAILSAALAGRQVVELPAPEADTGTIALWRPGTRDWLVIEAWADSQAIPLVRISGSTNVSHIVRERALAMLAAADRAEQMAAEQTARASGSGVGDQHG